MNRYCIAAALAAVSTLAAPAAANLLVNGNFEASSSQTMTPPGWTNIGHSEGVIAYAAFGTPAYDGLYYYDLGGYGDASGPSGDGIRQSVATMAGSLYTLTFGLSSENQSGTTSLDVLIGSQLTTFILNIDGTGTFQKPFATQTISYFATSALTTISFIESVGGGANDPMIDGVIFDLARGGTVPEPASWALMIAGIGLAGGGLRRRRGNERLSIA
jgi:hypothetical protein